MSTVEEDVARVNAVHAALSGPAMVWVAQWDTKRGNGIELFASEAGARTQLLEWLDAEKSDLDWSESDFQATRQAIIDRVSYNFSDQNTLWYSIRREALQP